MGTTTGAAANEAAARFCGPNSPPCCALPQRIVMLRYVITIFYRSLKDSVTVDLPPGQTLDSYCASVSRRPDVERVLATAINETNVGTWRGGKKS
jgi:hypothetical protein